MKWNKINESVELEPMTYEEFFNAVDVDAFRKYAIDVYSQSYINRVIKHPEMPIERMTILACVPFHIVHKLYMDSGKDDSQSTYDWLSDSDQDFTKAEAEEYLEIAKSYVR